MADQATRADIDASLMRLSAHLRHPELRADTIARYLQDPQLLAILQGFLAVMDWLEKDCADRGIWRRRDEQPR